MTEDKNLQEAPREETVEIEVKSPESVVNTDDLKVEVEVQEENQQEKQVSDAQKRINRLTKKMREAERREQEALRYAESVKKENSDLQTRFNTLDKGYIEEYSGRVESELESAKQNLRNAMSTGDSDAVVEAQSKIAELTVAKERVRQSKVKYESEEQPQTNATQQQFSAPQNKPQAAADPRAEEWAEENKDWFGKNSVMTYASFGIHNDLKKEGFDLSSEEYYTEVDRRLKESFPNYFLNGNAGQRPAQTVASASRAANSTGRSRKIKLTPSQVAIAKKLGVPLEEYAKHVKE
jgi:hypothetical protein